MTMESSASPVIARTIDLQRLLAKKSYFLLGPRQTGKSFLIRQTLPGVHLFDLLDSPTYLTLGRNPERIGEELTERDKLVVIDEVQRLPHLLNEVHRLIEAWRIAFCSLDPALESCKERVSAGSQVASRTGRGAKVQVACMCQSGNHKAQGWDGIDHSLSGILKDAIGK
jgi:AAA domain